MANEWLTEWVTQWKLEMLTHLKFSCTKIVWWVLTPMHQLVKSICGGGRWVLKVDLVICFGIYPLFRDSRRRLYVSPGIRFCLLNLRLLLIEYFPASEQWIYASPDELMPFRISGWWLYANLGALEASGTWQYASLWLDQGHHARCWR